MDELMILASKLKWDVWFHEGVYYRRSKANTLYIQSWKGDAWSLFDSLPDVKAA